MANADAPVNACSLSVGVAADASSSCSTTSVGLNQPGGLADANAPITAQDNAIGLLNEAPRRSGSTSGQSSASTSQDGDVNADAPVSICSVNVGLVGNTSSDCDTTGTSGPTTQTGAVDAEVPVTVCDVIAEIDGNSSANCPQQSDPATQQGQAADVFVPVTACGAVVEVDGSANGMCMPDAGFPLVNDLPTNDGSQSAPVDGVIPVNACSVVVAVDGTASNSCEPSHVGATTTGLGPRLRAGDGLRGDGRPRRQTRAHLHRDGLDLDPDRQPGEPGNRRHGAGDPLWRAGGPQGSADASCPQPTTSASTVGPTPGRRISGVGLLGGNAGSGGAGLQPAPLSAPTVATAASGASSLASTGAPLLLEVLIGLGALVDGPGDQPFGPSPSDGRFSPTEERL